ncbi:winged helix-turn-helix transcriptional regulator [Collimonas pratensis]|nr:helix-turn-helix domain-containing protein [Collimonas pratensis]NKI72333.1 transcriptional regulator [Collimonas pratensis]
MALIDKPVRGSKTGKPIMALLDLLGRRWVLRVIWELREGPMVFRELQARCDDMSPSVLNGRLAELREALIVETCDTGYQLTKRGAKLLELFDPLGDWVESWAAALRSANK